MNWRKDSNKRTAAGWLPVRVFLCVIGILLCFPMAAMAQNLLVRTVNVGITEDGQAVASSGSTTTSSYFIASQTPEDISTHQTGEQIRYKVTVKPNNGYRFSGKETRVNVIGKNLKLESQSITGSQITVRLSYWKSAKLEPVDVASIRFDDRNEYVLRWDPVMLDGKEWKTYEVRVMVEYMGEKRVETRNVSSTRVDLSDLLTDGYHTIAIRAVTVNASKARYIENSAWVTVEDMAEAGEDNTKGKFSGTGNKMIFLDPLGERVYGWVKINGGWYYCDPANQGRAVVDRFMEVDGSRYYFGSNGVMATGWIEDGGYWYYLHPVQDENYGKPETGWVSNGPDGPWYYLNAGENPNLPYGAMYADTVTPDGYTVDATGKWVE